MLRFDHYSNEVFDLPPWIHCKGGSAAVPAPSPEETALRRKELENIVKQEQWLDMFEPMVLDAMGYRKSTTENPEYQAQLQEWANRWSDRPNDLKWTEEQIAKNPAYYATLGAPSRTISSVQKLTEEERLAGMGEMERADYEIQRKIQQRELDALEGKLPISPALEATLGREQAGLEEELSQKLGPNWRLSTPATTKLGEFKKRAELVREEARRGMLDTTSALNLAQGNKIAGNTAQTVGYANQFPNRWGGLLQGYNTAMQPYMQDRAYQISASMQNQANSAAQMGGFANLLGQLGGSAMMAYALSSPKFKKNIKKADDDEALDMVKDANTYEYNYKGEAKGTPKQVGYMADEAPGDSGDGVVLDLGKVTGLHAAAIKAMAKKIDKLEKAVKEK